MEDRENFEISTHGLKARCSASELPIQSGTPYQTRTDTESILSALPLPIGLREQKWLLVLESNQPDEQINSLLAHLAPNQEYFSILKSILIYT